MAKWYGNIGFSETVEYEPGSFESSIVERPYFGDVISNRWKRQNSQGINDDINLSNQISIVSDPYVDQHAGQNLCMDRPSQRRWSASENRKFSGIWRKRTSVHRRCRPSGYGI